MASQCPMPNFMISTSKKSEFHQTCVPAVKQPPPPAAAPAAPPGSRLKDSELDAVRRDEIWKQSVNIEKKGAKNWEENWGFMTEFDEQGRPKSAKSMPAEMSGFSDNVPNTNAGNHGSRLNTELGILMQNLEFKFHAGTRKKKLDDEMICY